MSKVLITRSKLDDLATTIAAKSGATLPLTIAQMDAAVQGIVVSDDFDGPTFKVTYTGGTMAVTCDKTFEECYQMGLDSIAMVEIYDGEELGERFIATPYISDDGIPYVLYYRGVPYSALTYLFDGTIRLDESIPSVRQLEVTENGEYAPDDYYVWNNVTVNVSSPAPTLQSKSATPTESAQTITADSGYDGLSSVSVGAISNTYVGSGITQRSSTDLTASGATVTVPAGYYAEQASKAVASGSAGTPTATKGTVSNHAVSVTPSVTNGAGYIEGGTKTGTAVTVAASELVSGTVTISGSGTTDVTNYASASVAAGGATASATKGTVSNHSVTVTPSVTRTAGYVTAGTANGTEVTVSASELVSGTYTVDSSGTKDVTNYASASVPSGSATASATKGSVSNHSVSVTPSVTRTAGWVSAGTASGTAVTVSASELVSGSETKTENGTYDVTNLAQLVVNVDGSNYIKTVVVPQQTFTASSSDHQAMLTSTGGFEDGGMYLITFDGDEYVSSCTLHWSTNYCVGDINPFMGNYTTENVFPFGLIWESNVMNVATRDTSQHTVKVEHLELVGSSVDLVAKTITANGTYAASSDSVDGYSSVTVAIPIVTYHTSSSAPTSSQGSDGDLWLVTA